MVLIITFPKGKPQLSQLYVIEKNTSDISDDLFRIIIFFQNKFRKIMIIARKNDKEDAKFVDSQSEVKNISNQLTIKRKTDINYSNCYFKPNVMAATKIHYKPEAIMSQNVSDAINNSVCEKYARQDRQEESLLCKKKRTVTKKFQRKRSQKSFERSRFSTELNTHQKQCSFQDCLSEKILLKKSIEILKSNNQKLLGQIDKNEINCTELKQRIASLQQEIKQKNAKISDLNVIVSKKQVSITKMYEAHNEKHRQIVKMEDIILKLQKQIECSGSPQAFTPISLQSTRIISQLNNKLKYTQIEAHMLKKVNHDRKYLEEQINSLVKQNSSLRERIRYYVKQKNLQYIQNSSSERSLSLNLSEASQRKTLMLQ